MAIPATFRSGMNDLPWNPHEPTSFNGGVIIIAYGSDGLAPKWKPEIERHADELKNAGYLVVIPEFLQSAPALGDDNSDEVFSSILARHLEWGGVLRDAIAAAKTLPSVDPSRIGLLGFSLGGFLSLRIRDAAKTLVEYFAPYKFPTRRLLGEPVVGGIGTSTNPRIPIHIHHGTADELVPIRENADPIEVDLKAEGATVTRTNHAGAAHGFLGSDTDNATARDASRKETVAFIVAHL